MNTELRKRLYNMFLNYYYEDSMELLRSIFTTLVVMEDLNESEIAEVLTKLYKDADIYCLDISYNDFYNEMTEILIQR